MHRLINKWWLTVAYLIETFQLDPAETRLRLMERRHSVYMRELATIHAREKQKAEDIFLYNHHMLGLRMDWLWRKVETLREHHGSAVGWADRELRIATLREELYNEPVSGNRSL